MAGGGTTGARVVPSGTYRGNAELAGVRGQGLGIPWPLLGCPCRLLDKVVGGPMVMDGRLRCLWKYLHTTFTSLS